MKHRCHALSVLMIPVLTLALTGCSVAGADHTDSQPAASQPARDASTSPMPMNTASRISKSGYDITPLSRERVKELAAKLDPEAYKITQSAGTERAFCGTLLDNKKDGTYVCVVCGLPLFASEHKFNSGTGWPSFYREFDPQHVARHDDSSHGMTRTEINCARCTAHLGHVFDDGPKPTGERHCLNSASLKFYENGAAMPAESLPASAVPPQTSMPTSTPGAAATETAYFAGGCFWGIEHYFQKGPGVIEAVSGYMQGRIDNPTYKQVCNGDTGHAEAVKVVFDPSRITYRQLLEAFFKMHDPTQLNRQGPDYGEQYRSGIYTTTAEQQQQAEAFIKELQKSGRFGKKQIVTQVESAKMFYSAEDYHQDYIEKTGRACHVADPW